MKGNYNIKRITNKKQRAVDTNNRRSVRTFNKNNSLQQPSKQEDVGSILSGYVRCYVEDYMSLQDNACIRLLYSSDQIIFEDHQPIHQLQLSSSKFDVFDCVVNTAPNYEWVNQSLTYKDIKHAFTRGNYGSYIQIDDGKDPFIKSDSILLTWREVLLGKSTGVQVWREQNSFRDMIDMFKNKRKSKDGMMLLLNGLHDKIYGDRVQLYHLIHCYYQTNLQHQTSTMKDMSALINTYKPPVLHGTAFNTLIDCIDNVFKDSIAKSFYTFTSINKPLITDEQVALMIDKYKTKLPNHYHTMKTMYSFQKKEKLVRNMHLKTYEYYDRLLFHQFLSQSRILNSHNLVHFSMISTGASYGQGISSNALVYLTSSGLSCSFKTMMKKLKAMNYNMNDVITQSLSSKKHFVIVLDNNQKGNCKKYQRNGSSNEFVKVTGRFFKECYLFKVDSHINKASIDGHVPITYINQVIPSIYLLPAFNHIAPFADNENTIAVTDYNYELI